MAAMDVRERHLRLLTETIEAVNSTLDLEEVLALVAQRVAEAMHTDACYVYLYEERTGELVLRADQPFAFAAGYFGMPDKTVEAWRNLWFHTGDRVVRDADGRYRFLDRMKDAIRRRGENVSAFEVEQVLLSHPAVAVAAVFPVASDLAEDEVAAALVLHPGQQVAPAALVEHCAPRLPYFAVPRFLRFTDVLPTTENGKVRKFMLREQGVTPDTWDREKAGITVANFRKWNTSINAGCTNLWLDALVCTKA